MVGVRVPEDIKRVAAIDVGTNTVLCLVADVGKHRLVQILADEERFARLGEGVDASGCISDAAMDRVVDILYQSAETAERLGARHIRIGATSASRDARNIDALAERTRNELGLDYQLLTGDEEAELTCRGALAFSPHLETAYVLDIGGGSTELAVWDQGAITYKKSLDIGSVRITERYFSSLPPAEKELNAAIKAIQEAFATTEFPVAEKSALIEAGGTTRVLSHLIGAEKPVPRITREEVNDWFAKLLNLTPDDILQLNPDLLSGREDVTTAALLIMHLALETLRFDALIASPGGLRHGLALSLADDL